MPYATVSDVATRLGRPITDMAEQAQIQAWLDDVESLISARLGNLADLVAAGTPTVGALVMVEATAVIRKVKNPDGYSSETIDDYTYRYNDAARRGDLFLTDEEWGHLLGDVDSAAGSTRPGFEPDIYGPPAATTWVAGPRSGYPWA